LLFSPFYPIFYLVFPFFTFYSVCCCSLFLFCFIVLLLMFYCVLYLYSLAYDVFFILHRTVCKSLYCHHHHHFLFFFLLIFYYYRFFSSILPLLLLFTLIHSSIRSPPVSFLMFSAYFCSIKAQPFISVSFFAGNTSREYD